MRDWRLFVRQEFRGRQEPSEQAIAELAQHVEETWRSARAAGLSEDEALARARAELTNAPATLPPNMVAEPSRGLAGLMAAASRDLRYALRILRGQPGFTAVAVVTLALGIGANTAIFSVVRSLLLEPLPFRDPERLVMLWEADAKNPTARTILSAPNYKDFAQGVQAFARTAIWEYQNFNFSGDVEAERVAGVRTAASSFEMLGVAPVLGRTFTPEEDAPGHDVAIISYGLWLRRFGGSADVIGRTARINARSYEIIGVMPATFRFPQAETAVWTPIAFNAEDQGRGSHSFFGAARLKPGVSLAAAQSELTAVAQSLARRYPESNGNTTAAITPMSETGLQQLRPTLLALSGAVALVLAIACVNVANLLLAQSTARRREFAIRAAIGASRRRLAAQMLTEALVIAALGGAAGMAVALGCTRVLAQLLPATMGAIAFRDPAAIHIDRVVLAFTSGLSLLTGLIFGLAPIAGLRRTASDLKGAGDRGATGRMTLLRGVLVGTEVALALIVLVGAGLMVKSLVKLLDNDPGLDPSNVLLATMSLPQADFFGPPVRKTFCDAVSERVGSLPGVLAVGAISHLPLTGQNAGRSFSIEGKTFPPGQNPSASYRLTCPGYFKAMGIKLLKGRDFDSRDATDAPGVVIINQATADKYWPGEEPLGRRFMVGNRASGNPMMTVVGVVANTRNFGLDDDTSRRLIFRPYSQAAWPVMTIVAKTAADPAGFAASVRSALQRIDPDLPVNKTMTMTEIETASTGARRFPLQLLGAFGIVALLLAVIGVYGVVSYIVSQRTREIGIRVALGARRGQVMRLIITGAMRPIGAGIAAGAIGAIFAARLLGTLLYNVTPADPAVLGALIVVLTTAGIAASLVPGARAARIDPITVLKAE